MFLPTCIYIQLQIKFMLRVEPTKQRKLPPKLTVTVINPSMEGPSPSGSSLSLDWECFSERCRIKSDDATPTNLSPMSPNRTYQDRLILPLGYVLQIINQYPYPHCCCRASPPCMNVICMIRIYFLYVSLRCHKPY